MNSLIITNTHILFGEWSSIRENYILNDLKYVALSKPIKEVLKSQNSIRTVLKEALDNFPVSGNHVAIAIDDELLYHDKFTSEESLTKREIWDYIQWEAKQKWGELGNYYTTFAEIDSPNPNSLHSIMCPAFLVSEIKALITNKGGKPIWAGPLSTIYLENSEYRNAIYMTDDDTYIKFFYRGRDGYSEGKLRFIAGQPNVTVGIGDKEEQTSLFSSPSDAREFVSIDLISDTKNAYLRQYRYKRIVPFEGIDVKIDDIPENVSFISLNALSIIIRDFSFDNLVNFFDPIQIQDRKYKGVGKLSFDQEGKIINKEELSENHSKTAIDLNIRKEKAEKEQAKKDRAEKKRAEKERVKKERAEKKQAINDSVDMNHAEKEQAKIDRADKKRTEKEQAKKDSAEKKKPKIKEDAKDKNKRKEVNIFPFLLIVLLGLSGYFLFFTEVGKDSLTKFKEKINFTKPTDIPDGSIIFDQRFNQSASLIQTYLTLTSMVSPDSIISLNLVDSVGLIAFVGKDSLDIPNLQPKHYSIEPIECCGGVKHKVDFDIKPLQAIRYNIWLNSSDVIDQLQSSLGITKIRRLDMINENVTKYNPIIFEVDSLSQIDNTIQYLKFVSDNVIVRKIDITNTPPNNNYTGKFYIAVFEPL